MTVEIWKAVVGFPDYAVSPATICIIRAGKVWQHLKTGAAT